MNEFEQYLASNYDLKPGDDVPDDIYDRASAEFLQSRTTVPSIAPNASAFDLDRAIPNAAPAAPAAQPRQQEANPLQGTPFDYGRAVPILEQFASDYIDKENLVRGAKYGDKADIEADWMNSREGIYGPALQELGVSPAKAQIAAISVERGKARNMLEALGMPEPQAGGDSSQMTQEKAARIKEAQGIYANLMAQSESTGVTEADARSFREQAAIIGDNISTELGNKELAPLDWKSQIEGTRKAIQAVTEAGGGTVNYRGIEYAPEEFGQLDKYLQTDEKNAWIKATQNPGSLRVSLQAAKLGGDGTPLKTQDERDNRYMALREQLNPNEWYQDLDGSVKIYGGPEEEGKELDMIPKRLKPALKGAGVVAGNVAEAVAPMLTEENVAMAANAVLPVVGYGSVKTTAAAMRNPQEAVAKLGRAAVTAGIPFGMLAMKGIDYLSEVGRKAEDEEKKKLAGQ
jgi:hypothetical protein